MAVTNNKSIKSASTKLASDLATAKAKTTGMDTSRINSAGTYQELSRISKGSRKSTDLLPPGYKEGVGIEPTPTVAPIEAPTPTVAPIQEPPQANAGVITPQEALKNAQASGTPPPQDSGEARSQLGKFMPSDKGFYKLPNDPNPDQVYDATGKKLSYDEYIARGGNPDFSGIQMGVPDNAITQQIEADPRYQEIQKIREEFNDVTNQRASLTDEYKKLTKQLGINEINTELMNMKNVIDGTEDDLRAEITKAGGFATESQVMALTNARNKQLVKNYNNLLETKQMAMETLNTMIGLAAQDRQFAQQAVMAKLQFAQQDLEYRDKMKANSQMALQKIVDAVGYAGIYSGDPWQDAITEKTLGLQSGQLSQLANYTPPMSWEEELARDKMMFDNADLLGLGGDSSGLTSEQRSEKNTIISNMRQDPDIKNFIEIRDAYERVKTGVNQNSAAGDIALIFNYMKMLDPGSTVREGEFATAQNAGSIPTQILNLYNKAMTGERLSSGQRQDFFNTAQNLYNSKKTYYDRATNFWGSQADAAGIPRDMVLRDYTTLTAGNPIESFIANNPKALPYAEAIIRSKPNATEGEILSYLQMLKVSGSFNGAGNAIDSKQVKGYSAGANKLPMIKMDNQKVAPITSAYPQGSRGGQCGVWVRSIVNRQGYDYPPVGDTLASKMATVKKYGSPISQARQGSVLITAENKKTGHVAYILGRSPKGFIVAESNYGLNEKVSYGRVIPYNSPNIIGIINPKKK